MAPAAVLVLVPAAVLVLVSAVVFVSEAAALVLALVLATSHHAERIPRRGGHSSGRRALVTARTSTATWVTTRVGAGERGGGSERTKRQRASTRDGWQARVAAVRERTTLVVY